MTKDEKRWLDAITQLGCIVCIIEGIEGTPAEPHHRLSGGRRMGHRYSIPLCPPHHRSGRNDARVVSRDQCQRRFEARYGTEAALQARTEREVRARGLYTGGTVNA